MNSLSPSYIARPIITNFDMRASNVEWKICREMTSTLIHRAPAWSYTAQRYAQARSLLSSSVRLSVCLSVTSSNFLLGPVAPSLWFFFDSSTRTLQWGWKINGVVNFAIFNRNHCLSRKRYEIGPWLLWNVNRKRLVRIETCRFRWPWPYPNFKVTTFFEVEYLRNGAGCLRDKVTIEHE